MGQGNAVRWMDVFKKKTEIETEEGPEKWCERETRQAPFERVTELQGLVGDSKPGTSSNQGELMNTTSIASQLKG